MADLHRIEYSPLKKTATVGAFKIEIEYRPEMRDGKPWWWGAESNDHHISGWAANKDAARRAVRKALIQHAIDRLWKGDVS